MSGRNKVSAQHFCVLKKGFEFDLAIAQDVRIRRAACLVFMEEVFEYVIPVLCSKVSLMKFYAKRVADLLGVCKIFFCRAVFRPVIFVPVLHEQALHLVALFNQQVGRYGRINTARHADDDFGIGNVCHSGMLNNQV